MSTTGACSSASTTQTLGARGKAEGAAAVTVRALDPLYPAAVPEQDDTLGYGRNPTLPQGVMPGGIET
jgi:hypothetical protein